MALIDKLTAIANAIRAKDGTSDTMTLAEMPSKIAAIQTGITPTGSIDITENGTYDVTDKASAVVNVAGSGGATEPYVEETFNTYGNVTKAILHGYTKIRDYMYKGSIWLEDVHLSQETSAIGIGAFDGCTELKSINLDSITKIFSNGFQNCKKFALSSLPSELTSLGNSAFSNCSLVSISAIPQGVTKIGDFAFAGCTKILSITFKGKPTTISSSAFDVCTNLTTINVPWAEGEVANAPWGATNATINYNYTHTGG